MAKSISEAQAEALADGFLDGFGEAFKPKKALSKIILVAGKFVEEAQNNLNKSDRNASGALSESITIVDPVKDGNNIRVDISMLYYWKFINDGVTGVISQQPSSPYKFKNLFVSKKMLKAIRKWVIKEGLKFKAKGQGKPISKREKFRKSITDTSTSTAYAISRAVKAKGLKKTNFVKKALAETNKYAKQEIGKGFKADIIDAIPKKIN
jgi:hypothetical protein